MATIQYLATLAFLFQLGFLVYNSYWFLYKQKRYKTLPLLSFYILSLCLTALRIHFNIWFYCLERGDTVLTPIMMPLLKIDIGLNQCWVMFELILNLH